MKRIAAVLGALLLGACGSAAPKTPAAPVLPKPDKATYVAAAIPICSIPLALRLPDMSAPHANVLAYYYLRDLVPLLTSELTKLEALTPPAGDEATIATIVAALQRERDDVQSVYQGTQEYTQSQAAAIAEEALGGTRYRADHTALVEAATAYGLGACYP